MFEISKFKKQARQQLKGRWTTAVLASLITLLICGCFIIAKTGLPHFHPGEFQMTVNGERIVKYTPDTDRTVTLVRSKPDFIYEPDMNLDNRFSLKDSLVSRIPSIKKRVLKFLSRSVFGILMLALCTLFHTYYVKNEKITFGDYLRGFNHWFKAILGFWWYWLWVHLWALLFIIPGFVKFFAYSQLFFIMAENPKMGVIKAMKISKVMTNGFKGDLFLMCLSFIGWELLSCFTLGILQLWLIPYMLMSFTNAYQEMKLYAIRTGTLSLEDFN